MRIPVWGLPPSGLERCAAGGRSQRGFNLVELLIAMALGLFLVQGVLRVFTGNKDAYRWVNAHSKLQENFRFAVDTLSDKLRNSGYQGCAGGSGKVYVTLSSPTAYQNNFAVKLRGYAWDGTSWSPGAVTASSSGGAALAALPASIANAADRNSDIITFRGTSAAAVPVEPAPGAYSSTAPIRVFRQGTQGDSLTNLKDSLAAGNTPTAMITDCINSSIFPVTAIAGPASNFYTVTHGKNLSGVYTVGSELAQVATETYYVSILHTDGKYYCSNPASGTGPDQCGTAGNCETPALCRAQGTSAGRRIIEGVERLRISYGLDTDNDSVPNRYVNASGIATANEWEQVVSVELGLLLRTDDEIRKKQGGADFVLAGQAISVPQDSSDTTLADDKFMRRAINQTVAIRNRLQ